MTPISLKTQALYQYLYPEGINPLAFAFWWHYYAPPDWHNERPGHQVVQDAYEAWARTLPTPQLDTPTAESGPADGVHICLVCGLETPATGDDSFYPAIPACGHYTKRGFPDTVYRPRPLVSTPTPDAPN